MCPIVDKRNSRPGGNFAFTAACRGGCPLFVWRPARKPKRFHPCGMMNFKPLFHGLPSFHPCGMLMDRYFYRTQAFIPAGWDPDKIRGRRKHSVRRTLQHARESVLGAAATGSDVSNAFLGAQPAAAAFQTRFFPCRRRRQPFTCLFSGAASSGYDKNKIFNQL